MINFVKIAMVLALGLATGAAVAELPDSIIIPHGLHFDSDVDCATCHSGVAETTAPGQTFYPEMDVCADCHDVDDEETCSLCHTNVDNAGEYFRPQFNALFNHGLHTRDESGCASCHGDPALASPVLPVKADCRQCHATAEDFSDCRMCHASEFELRPTSHNGGWINSHGLQARTDETSCTQCHTQTGCLECHSGDNVRPRSHGLNYEFNHALDARSNSLDCAVCHMDTEYCSSCHQANRVLPTDHSMAGWLSSSDGGRHATEGRFEMESCIACHSAGAEEPTCARCHGR